MSNLFDRIRSGAEQAAGKAAFEADKLRRVTALQGKIRSLRGDFDKNIVETGQTAFALYQKEQIAGPEALRQACAQLANIQAQIAAHEQQIEEIRAETFVEPQANPQYGRLCPNGHGAIPAQDNFCQKCGAQAIEIPPPQASPPCQNCGAALAAGARFCAECGQAVKQSMPPAAVPGKACANCGAQLLPDSTFCTECGQRVAADTPQSLPDESAEEFTPAEFPEQLEEDEPPAEADAAQTEKAEELLEEEEAVFESEGEETAVSPQPDETTADTCPVCDAPLVPDALFCTECGHRFKEGDPT